MKNPSTLGEIRRAASRLNASARLLVEESADASAMNGLLEDEPLTPEVVAQLEDGVRESATLLSSNGRNQSGVVLSSGPENAALIFLRQFSSAICEEQAARADRGPGCVDEVIILTIPLERRQSNSYGCRTKSASGRFSL